MSLLKVFIKKIVRQVQRVTISCFWTVSDIANLWRVSRTVHYRCTWGEVTRTYWVRCFLMPETSFEKRDCRQQARNWQRHYPPSNYRELPRVNVHAYSTSSQVRTSGTLIFTLRSRGRLNVAPARSQFSIAPICRHVSRTSIRTHVRTCSGICGRQISNLKIG